MARNVQTPGALPPSADAANVPARAEPTPAGSTPTNRDPKTLTAPVFIEGQGWLCPEPQA
jgi:hypothetical protein